MRILLSRVAYDRFWPMVRRGGTEALLLTTDGRLEHADGSEVDVGVVDAEVAWGTGDLFVDGGPGRTFMKLVHRAPSLRWLQSPSAGYEGKVFSDLADRGVRISATHDNAIPVAECAIRSVLEHFQGGSQWRDAETRKDWVVHEFREVYDTTWLVVGLGWIGGNVARLATAFGASVIGCRRNPGQDDPAERVVTPADLPAVVGEADVIVLAAPGGTETRHLVDDAFLRRMKRGSVLVNVARGSLVDEVALLEALDRGTPEAAMLDVFATEPLPTDHPFWTHPAVSVTPHNTAMSTGRYRRQAELFSTNIDHFLAGDALVHEVTELARSHA
jgi:phosphoglycerate dehydrogenase-like enzyme